MDPTSSAADGSGEIELKRGGASVGGSRTKEDDAITLVPGWRNRGGGGNTSQDSSESGSHLLCSYTKEQMLTFFTADSDCPPDFLALPYILSQHSLKPVNLSQDLLKEAHCSFSLPALAIRFTFSFHQFEDQMRKYLYNVCPSRGGSIARGRGRGRGCFFL